MNELLMLYHEIPKRISSTSDIDTVKKTDDTLSEIENTFPELMGYAHKYFDDSSNDICPGYNVCVIGADSHGIAHTMRNRFPEATIIWVPDLSMFDDSYIGKINGLILSRMAVDEMLGGNSVLDTWVQVLVNEGFVLFEYDAEKNRSILHNVLNRNNLVIYRWNNNGVIYCGYKPCCNKPEEANTGDLKHKYKKMYCVCPAIIKTGGTELIHQLVYHINRLGGDAEIAYARTGIYGGYVHPELADYVAGHINTFEEIEDACDNIVLFPESWVNYCDKINKSDIWIWWLSVDNFKILCDTEEELKYLLEVAKAKVSLHLVQSEYAKQYIISEGIKDKMIRYLSDYINDEYLDTSEMLPAERRRDIVLYNPKKGFDYVKKLIAEAPEICWTPIENMTTKQVKQLMTEAKIYIDFGNHPGKDRIPREAAMCGCIVITGRKGSAAYDEDVFIPDRYKLDEETVCSREVIAIIRSCLADYEKFIDDFAGYREKTSKEKEEFIEGVRGILKELL